jgi:hypothetical protein
MRGRDKIRVRLGSFLEGSAEGRWGVIALAMAISAISICCFVGSIINSTTIPSSTLGPIRSIN